MTYVEEQARKAYTAYVECVSLSEHIFTRDYEDDGEVWLKMANAAIDLGADAGRFMIYALYYVDNQSWPAYSPSKLIKNLPVMIQNYHNRNGRKTNLPIEAEVETLNKAVQTALNNGQDYYGIFMNPVLEFPVWFRVLAPELGFNSDRNSFDDILMFYKQSAYDELSQNIQLKHSVGRVYGSDRVAARIGIQ